MAAEKPVKPGIRAPATLLRLVSADPAKMAAQQVLATPDVHEPPADFDGLLAAHWRDVVAVLRQTGTWRSGVGDLVRLYCIAFAEAKAARQHLQDEGLMVHPEISPGVPDTAKSKVVNPWRGIARDAEASAARLAQVLGLVPAARRGG